MSGNEVKIRIAIDKPGVDSGLKETGDQIDGIGGKAGRAGAAARESFNSASTSATAFGSGVKAAFGAISTGALIYGVKSAAIALIDAQQSAQKLRNSLEYSAGGAAAAAGEIAYLRDVTRTLGLDFATAGAAYSKFAAATRDSGISAAQTKTVFEGIAAASARMGLSADETQGALLALSQMASKGTVQAEELRGQLGERLPGSFNIAAKAMGVTTAELGKMLEQGQVLASDFLPKFGEALKSQFQAPLNSLTQEINRLSSAWALWKTELSEGSDGGGFKWLTNGLNESTAAMRALGSEAGIVHKILVGIGGFEASLVGAGKFDTQALQAQAADKLKKANDRLSALEEKQSSGKLNQVEREQLEHYTASVKAAREELLRLADVRGKETGIKLPDLKGDVAAQKAALAARASAYLGDATNGSKSAKMSAEIDKENKAFQTAIAGFSETDERYIKMLAEHNARIAEIKKKGADSGAANDVKQQFTAQLAAEKDYAATSVALTKDLVAQHVITQEDGAERIVAAQRSAYSAQKALLVDQLAKTTDAGDRAQIAKELKEIENGAAKAESEYTTAMTKIAATREAVVQARIADQVGTDIGQAEAIESENRALREQTAELGLSSEALVALRQSRLNDRIALETWRLGLIGGADAAGAQADAIRATIAALQDSKVALAENASAQRAADAIKAQGDIWRSIDDTAKQTFVSIWDGGKSAFDRLRDTLKNGLYDLLYQMTAKKWLIQIATSISGTAAAESAFGTAATTGIESIIGTAAKSGYEASSDSFFSSSGSGLLGFLTGARAAGGPVSAGGTYLVGEHGPELLTMGGSGFVTPNTAISGSGNVIVNVVNNATGTQATASERTDSSGGRIIDVLIEQVEATMGARIRKGNGLAPVLESQYSLNRAAGAWT